ANLQMQGITALHKAADAGAIECMKLLILHGADVNARDSEKVTPLDAAMAGDWYGEFKERIRKEESCAELLLQHGADVDVADRQETTPLMAACMSLPDAKDNAYRSLCQLLEHGANVNTVDNEGRTAL